MLERLSHVNRETFFRDYFHGSRPVILTGLMNDWPACDLWRPDYLKAKCGHAQVEIMGDRDSDADYEANCHAHKRTINFGDYVDLVVNQPGNNSYLVANNRFLDKGDGAVLLEDIRFPEAYLNPAAHNGRTFFWFGPAGTVTPLHYDVTNLLLAQVIGHKRMCLISPEQRPHLYNSRGVFSDVDYDKPDVIKFPLWQNVVAEDFILNPGEMLFIPTGWFHHVRALTPSISVSFTNFLT